MPETPDFDAIGRMESLGRAGFTISVCCGPCGAAPFLWTVQVLSSDGQEFEMPIAAHDFRHAVEIAELESRHRGWLNEDV